MAKKRHRGGESPGVLQQRTCSLVGMANCLLPVQGSFAVIVHGPVDCTNTFLRHVPRMNLGSGAEGRFSSDRFFSSALTEADVTLGTSEEKLARCIDHVAGTVKPDILFVLGTCLSGVVGDDIRRVAGEARKKRKRTTIVAIPTGGLYIDRQPEVSDAFEDAMIRGVGRKARKARGSVALAGLSLNKQETGELGNFLEAAGLKLAAVLGDFASLDDWRAACRARLAVIVDAPSHPSLAAALEEHCDVECMSAPVPFGMSRSLEFYRSILKKAKVSGNVKRFLEGEPARTGAVVEAAAGTLDGLKAAYETGSALGFRVGQHAGEGLAHAAVFDELRMDVELLVQGVDSTRHRVEIEERLRKGGMKYPYRIFQDPGTLDVTLREGGYDLVYCSDGRREQTIRAGIPFLALGSLRPLLGGMRRNAKTVEASVRSLFLRRYAAYLG